MEDNKKMEVMQGLQLDGTPEERAAAAAVIKAQIEATNPDNTDREKIYKKRRDFYGGSHHLYSNVVNLRGKERDGHIMAVFNYIWRMSSRLSQALTGSPIKFKIKPEDEASEVCSIRAEMEENWHNKILRDNFFKDIVFKRNVTIQIRDGDFALKCIVDNDERTGKKIKIQWAENMEKLHVVWDDSAGTDYSAVIYRDLWSIEKIAREFNGYAAEPIEQNNTSGVSSSSHSDPYGVHSTSVSQEKRSPTRSDKLPKAWVSDGWGWFKVVNDETGESEWKMCNITMINDDVVQFVKTDYNHNPWILGHSFSNPGSPWSISFIDNLIDPQVELNDRQSEEGDMIRIGSNLKYVVVNMPNFNAESVKPGSGQVIFVEGENADFKQLDVNVNPFPTETYINRTMEHLFNLGLPKIALSAGSAPYTGKVGAIQYQAVSDLVDELRMAWSPVIYELFKRMQDYTIQFFPEARPFMMGYDEETGEEYGPVMREVQLDWDSILPQSSSDSIVDGATLYDRDAIPLKRFLEMAGNQDPMSIIKELKREAKDPELTAIKSKFRDLSRGAVTAGLEARKMAMQAEEDQAALMGSVQPTQSQGTPQASKPIMQKSQNDGRRGPPATAGVSNVGQTASQQGAVNQVAQNIRAGK